MTLHRAAIAAIALLATGTGAAQRPQGPDVNWDYAQLAEGYTSEFVGGPIEGAYRMFSLPDFAEVCARARASDVRTLHAAPRIDARIGVPIPYAHLKVDALDKLGVLVPKVPIAIESYAWSEVLETQSDRIEESVTPKQAGTIRLRIRTICNAPGGETFVTIDVRR